MRFLGRLGSGAGLRILSVAVVAACAIPWQGARAAVVVSSDVTQNMSCSAGVCVPTAASAVLNAGDLENLLASGNVEVTTTGAGVQAKNIQVRVGVSWSSSSALTLDARNSITVDQPVAVSGTAALTLTTDDGGKNGALSFGKRGSVSFASLSSSLTINGTAYTLVGDITSLASAIASNPSGDFALPAPYDASQDGTYASSPIPTTFAGSFEGLGNVISNFSLDDESYETSNKGFFAELGSNGSIADFGLSNANVRSLVKNVTMGTLVALSEGTIRNASATGNTAAEKAISLGGLVGDNEGTIAACHAKVQLGKSKANAGGLIGINDGTVSGSFATGTLDGATAGGLIGENAGTVVASFATGEVSGFFAGGLVGLSEGPVTNSFAAGHVRAHGSLPQGAGGGLIGLLLGGFTSTVSDSYATGNVHGGNGTAVGGLVGGAGDEWTVTNSYSTGDVEGGANSQTGGLIGLNYGTIQFAYSLGAPKGSSGASVGGLIGYDESQEGSLTDTYWDTDTSGITSLNQGAGNIPNDPGITGLSTAEFQSGLPSGFDPKVWAEISNINDGLPYLLANPPNRKRH